MTRSAPLARRLVAAGILAVSLASWMLPVQACRAGTQAMCPDCTAPCCESGHACDIVAACAASMLPVGFAPTQTLHKAVSAAIHADRWSRAVPVAAAIEPVERPPAYSPSTRLNIRFCSFQK